MGGTMAGEAGLWVVPGVGRVSASGRASTESWGLGTGCGKRGSALPEPAPPAALLPRYLMWWRAW